MTHANARSDTSAPSDPFRALADSVWECALVLLDDAGRITSWNPGAVRLTGLTAPEVVSRPCDILDCALAGLVRAARQGGRAEAELLLPGVGGVAFRAAASVVALGGSDSPSGYAVTLRDAGGRAPTGDVSGGDGPHPPLLDGIADGIFINKDDRVAYANPALLRMLGADSEGQVLGRSPFEFFHPDFHAAARERVREVLAGRPVPFMEQKYVRLDGGTVEVEVAAAPLWYGGEVAAFVTSRDITERKRAEEALRREREFVRLVLDTDPNLIFVKDAAGRFVLANKAMAALYGTTPEGLVGRGPGEGLPAPAECAEYRRVEEEVLRTGRLIARDEVNTRPDGRVRWFHTIKAPLPLPDGTTHVLGIAADVTDRKRAEDSLRANEEEYRAIFELGAGGQAQADPATGRLLRVNRNLCALLGYSESELLGMTFAQFTHPDDVAADLASYGRMVRGEVPDYTVEKRLVKKDGSVLWVQVTATVIRDAAGRPLRTLAVGVDVTERRRAEEALREREELLRALIANIPCGVFWKDRDCVYLGCNAQVARNHGLDPDRVPGLTDFDLGVAPGEAEFYRECDRRVMETGEPIVNLEETQTRPGGDLAVLLTSKVPLRDRSGRVAGVLGVYQDITERKRLEEQYRQSQKMEAVGQLAGGVAHDFNNLLTVINGYSDLLLGDFEASDPRREAAAAIRDAGERAARLVGQLLAFGRKAVVEPRVLDLNEVIDSTGKLLRRLIGEDVTITTALSPRLSRVRIDPGQAEQVLLNLAVNARDAMPKGGRLTIETRDVVVGEGDFPAPVGLLPGRHVLLSVADTGCGMTEKVMAHIFEPFFTTKGVGKGTGLGLATVYGIVKQAGGHVAVESRVGAGAVFTIFLPAVSGPPGSEDLEATRAELRGTEVVLLAEDEDGVRRLARRALEIQGYTVLEAATGAEAVRLAEAHPGPVHLLVTDVVMPDLGGRDLAEAVRERRPGVRVLFVSGHTDDAVLRHGVSQSADAFLQKPFTPLGLARKARAVLDEPA